MRQQLTAWLLCALSGTAWAQNSPPAPAQPAPPTHPVPAAQPEVDPYAATGMEAVRAEASRLIGDVREPGPKRFLIATSYLPMPADRVLYFKREPREVLTAAEYEALPPERKEGFTSKTYTEHDYYYTKYGSPLAYIRPLELICEHLGGGWEPLKGKRLFDFGYGGIGHLRLLASIGVDVVGVEVDPALRALYCDPTDTGEITGIPLGQETMPNGKLKLVHGRWPAEPAVNEAVGTGFDVIISKNTLKNGYINPEKPVDKSRLVNLGVSNEEYVKKAAASLNPGGLFVIYNISPAQKPEPEKWIPWADGRCPFPREMFEAAGFEILAFDKDDDEAARRVGKALEWDKHGMDLEADMFTHYTIVRKKAEPAPKPAAKP